MTVDEDMSPPELIVSRFLDELGLEWKHEYPVFILDEKERPRLWTPDFYLPKLGLFIEVCGSKRYNYEYRIEMFKKNDFRIIFLHHYKDEEKWKRYLVERIKDIHRTRDECVEHMLKVYNIL